MIKDSLAEKTLQRYAELNNTPDTRLQFVHMPEWIRALCEVLEREMDAKPANEPPAL